jgi:hypothetical protein
LGAESINVICDGNAFGFFGQDAPDWFTTAAKVFTLDVLTRRASRRE